MNKKNIIIFLLFNGIIQIFNANISYKLNKGQWPKSISFGTQFLNTLFFVNQNGFEYCIYNIKDLNKIHEKIHGDDENTMIHGHHYYVNFIGGNLSNYKANDKQAELYNYFIGKERDKWATEVNAFSTVYFKGVYNGIDIRLHSNTNNIKYDFIVKPNSNTNDIKLLFSYTNGLSIKENNLCINTSVGEVIELAPIAWQIVDGKKKNITCKYTLLANNQVGFVFPEGYDTNFELVIDPTIVTATYSGSSINSCNIGCHADENGNVYDLGYAFSGGYPTTIGAFQVNFGGIYDFVISKYSANGSAKIFSTYLGTDTVEFPIGIHVNKTGINVLGQTPSENFPVTVNALDTSVNGRNDFVVTKFSLSGNQLLGSTYVGGSNNEGVLYVNSGLEFSRYGEITGDTLGNVYILSATNSTNFPVSSAAISSNIKGNIDACAFKLNSNLSSLIWSTYLGGTGSENGRSIKIDGLGGAYCFGVTTSTNFPVSTGSYQPTKTGPISAIECYVSHINSTGTALLASTYIGTTGSDYAFLMDVDLNGDVYLTGNLSSPTLLVPTPGIYSSNLGYNFIYKLNGALTSLIFKTKYGNSVAGLNPNLCISAFRVDSCQNIYVAGWGQNTFQTTPGAFQNYGGGKTDMYMAAFASNCSSLKFASYYGGPKDAYNVSEHDDGGNSYIDRKGKLYLAICSRGGLPTTSNALQSTFLNTTTDTVIFNDAFVIVDFQTFVNAGSSYGANIIGCPPFTANFVSTTNTGTTYWDFGNGNTSTNQTEMQTYSNLGTYNILLVVTDTNTCNKHDSIKSILNVINPTTFDLGNDIKACVSEKTLLKANVSAVSYSWSTGQTTPNIFVTKPGNYVLTINNGGCNSSDDINVIVGESKFSERFINVITPNGDNINDCVDFSNYRLGDIEFILIDRWGKERYRNFNPNEKWCPDNLNDGTYFYVVQLKSDCTGESYTDKGFITVFK